MITITLLHDHFTVDRLAKMKDLESTKGFFDLCVNIPDGGENVLNDILLKLYKMGYRTVALNQTINDSAMDNDKKKKQGAKQVTNVVPDPIDVSKLNEKWEGKLCILNRITFICSNSTTAHTLAQCANLKKYDIYAFVPTKQDILEFACSQIKTDLITINPKNLNIRLNRKVYRQAKARDLYFEIQYVDFLRQETRVASLYNSYKLQMCHITSVQNIIISSGANNSNLIRNPYDIINLESLFGLQWRRACEIMSQEPRDFLLKARKRISGKAIFTVEFTKESKIDDDENVKKRKKNEPLD